MIDERLKRMARTIIDYSLKIKLGERVLIDSTKNCTDMLKYMIKLLDDRGAIPLVCLEENDIKSILIKHGSREQFEIMKQARTALLNNVDVYINMMDSDNCFDMSDVPAEKRALYQKYYFKPINFEIIVPKLRWITVDYPSFTSAQQFGMSTEAYEDMFFKAVNTDYEKLYRKMVPLKRILDKGRHIEIQAEGTKLDFDVTKCKSAICSGTINLPDGEIFVAPDLTSMNGYVRFNIPTRYQGNRFENVYLEFKNGNVINASASTNERLLLQILDSNEGNRLVGEFAIGTNPNIQKPTSNILFDEKILGSFHLALGNSHDLSDNGNRASIHWDMVKMFTPEFGGGEIKIDGQSIMKDGKFVGQELKEIEDVGEYEYGN